METLCRLFGKTREGYYSVSRERRAQRALTEKEIIEKVREVRSRAPGIGAFKLFLILKEIFLDRMTGRDRFYAMMHKNGLMLKPPRRRHTTCSNHNLHKYKFVARGFRPVAPNQLWVADITYIETEEGVVYLHLLTDAYTHEIIGWVLSDTLLAENTVAALDQAIALVGYIGFANLMHHSDRGSQYCSNIYVARLLSIGATISMTEDYKPTDNAVAERVNGIIKQEWLYRQKRPANKAEAEQIIAQIVDFYNNERPHLNNPGMLPPTKVRMAHKTA